MEKQPLVIYEGECFTIMWGIASNGQCQARDYFESLDVTDRAKAVALFKRMADVGKIYNTTKFKQETKKLYIFKPQPHRFFCFFVKGRRIFIISAYQKQSDKAPPREIARAKTLRLECLKHLEED